MLRLVKKAAAAKNIPLLALALFAAVFMGSQVYASVMGLQTEQWLYNDVPGCTETNAACYTILNTGDLDDECDQLENEVCGITAPDDGGQPLIEGQLEDDLESGNFQNKANIFTMPRTD